MSTTPASTSRGETAGQTETSNDNFTAPGHQQQGWQVSLPDQEDRLTAFLADRFPQEVGPTETPIETAVRLLTGLSAHRANRQDAPRCSRPFCNKPDGHLDGCGWVHYG